ncbi:MAG: PD-(D/E)XK nuclease-like domain-containing protein [Mycobacterium sp.]
MTTASPPRELSKADLIASPAISHSALNKFAESPLLYYRERIEKSIPRKEPSDAQIRGSQIEAFLRTGSVADLTADWVRLPEEFANRRMTEKYRAWLQDSGTDNAKVLTRGDYDRLAGSQAEFEAELRLIREGVVAHPFAKTYIDKGEWHCRLQWTDAEYGCECKGELDIVWNRQVIVDVKTANAKAFRDFPRECALRGYHSQAAYYQDAFEAWTGEVLPVAFVVIRNEQPYDCQTHEPTVRAMDRGRERYRALLGDLLERLRSGYWHGPTDTNIFDLPRWA